jgi:hypothetical protein
MILLLAFACAPPDAPVAGPRLVPLDGPPLLRRMSLDLRGVLPSLEELDTVEDDPDQLDAERDTFLDDPRLEDRLVSLLAETWHTRVDVMPVAYLDYHLPDDEAYAFAHSIGEEPLRLMAHVAVADLPWTDIVTADYTMANETLDEIWDIDYPADTSGWQMAWYLDGRPAAGVLSTNGLWWRYVTSSSNLNRGRAAAISRLLLCEDYLARPVSFSQTTSLSDADGTALAIRTEPACIGCHVSLDPVASAMFGFFPLMSYNSDEYEAYHAEREPLGTDLLGVAPAYYGTPIEGLAELGGMVAADPRFVRCTARSMAQALWRRDLGTDDFASVETFRQAFVADGLRMKPLLRAVTDSAEYRAGSLGSGATAADTADATTVRMITPDQLGTLVEDLTGFRWQYDAFDMLGNDSVGYRVLAGGVDGDSVASPQRDPGLTWALVNKRVAEAAAAYAVDHELVDAESPHHLFRHVTIASRPGDAEFTDELSDLHWRLYALRPEADALAAEEALWSAIDAESGPAEAWKGLVAALLRDPELQGY